MANNYNSLSAVEKLAYGVGDGACNIIWQTIMLFIAYFYTDIYGLSAIHMGIMFLVARGLDAVVDVAMGFISDRTRTKDGQFRPYLLWFCIPYGMLGALTFYTPDLGSTGKIIYAYVTYSLLSAIYSAINVPYCAMINNISRSPKERVSLQSYRFAFAAFGGILVSAVAMPLVKVFGQGDESHGYFLAMVVMGGLSIVMFLMCYFFTRERYIPPLPPVMPGQFRKEVLSDLGALWHNHDWRRLFALNIVNLIAGCLKTGVAIYFVTYYLQKPELISIFLVAILSSKLVGSAISPWLFGSSCRVAGYKLAMVIQALLMIVLFFIGSEHVLLIGAMIVGVHVINACATPLQWSMLSDVIDDVERSAGKNLSGLIFSTNLFAIKVGIAIGGAFIGGALAMGGYVGKAPVQTEEALMAIRLLFTVVPAVLILSLLWILRKYSLTDLKLKGIGGHDTAESEPGNDTSSVVVDVNAAKPGTAV